uniref:MHD domain-containing protein n=1 Tax=Photinus pyralis TaxID=7054 RepID=A0A1Y1MPJ5_PHOPY
MDSKGANPFLFAEDDLSATNSAVSNPFLMDGDDFLADDSTFCDNPFLSQGAATMTSTSTNPFAFDPMELGPAEAEPAADIPALENSMTDSTMDLITANTAHDFLNDPLIMPTIPPQKPTGLNLKITNTVNDGDTNPPHSGFDQTAVHNGPQRPPPPPRPPPSKETQDLLMSVMGAMDATSSHLLDKIPPTRTPSPVSMRDLHSPSPTPEPNLADLLDVNDDKSQEHQESDLLTLSDDNACDINRNPPLPPSNTAISNQPPPRPARPVSKPPRPLPPQKPPPPPISQPHPTPPKPPPPSSEVLSPPHQIEEPQTKYETQPSDDFDLFGISDVKQPAQKIVASTADIMNLYSTPAVVQSHPKPDLLFDSIANEMQTSAPITEEILPSNINVTTNATVDITISNAVEQSESLANTPIVQDNFISPEPSQSDLQMDTSDSQSKGSISSVTFNPFAEVQESSSPKHTPTIATELFTSSLIDTNPPVAQDNFSFGEAKPSNDEFDAFAMKFESAAKEENKNGAFDAFSGSASTNTWGNDGADFNDTSSGFGTDEPFDAFLSMQEPPTVPQSTPNKLSKAPSQDSDEEKDFSVFIRPKSNDNAFADEAMPVLAPPPSVPVYSAFTDSSPRFNPFDQQTQSVSPAIGEDMTIGESVPRSESQETPPSPLFDEDVSQPLEVFPRTIYTADGWEMQLRQPNKKKITGQRFWKKIFIRLLHQTDCVLLQLFNQKGDKDPFQELPLQPCYSVSDIGAQQYDNFGKIFTLKLQYIFYKERPGVRPGQVKKAERITNKLSKFASYAIQGDYEGVKEFGSDLKKLGLPVEHAPQVSQLMKLGSLNYEDLKQFSVSIEEALFKLQAHRDRALHYKMEEVQITSVDELYVEQDAEGHIEKQIARVRLFFLGFLTGMPDIELGVNDMRRQGKEVVGRHDIIPVITEEWIRLEDVEFHSCIQQDDYQNSHIIKFKPPDACYIELMRFRVRPPKNRELPLQLKTTINVTGNKVVIKADVLVPGFASRKLGQVPCEDVMIRIPIPECWIYLFRVEKHFRYGSVKSTHRRTGKIKGIERILGTMETLQESLIEVTSGQAKYEHQHRAIVWRCPRLPKEGQGAYTTHNLVCRLALTSYDQIPDQLAEYCYVEFTMPATQVSHTTVRSVSLQNSDSDDPPEKYVRYLARHEYRVGIEHTEGDNVAAYSVATVTKPPPAPIPEQPPAIPENESSDDSD